MSEHTKTLDCVFHASLHCLSTSAPGLSAAVREAIARNVRQRVKQTLPSYSDDPQKKPCTAYGCHGGWIEGMGAGFDCEECHGTGFVTIDPAAHRALGRDAP